MKRFISVNKDIFIRTLCLIFTLSFFTTQSAGEGDTMLAVNTLLFQFFYFFSYFIDGFAYAAEALTGRYIGARDKTNLRRAVRILFIWGISPGGNLHCHIRVRWLVRSWQLLTDSPRCSAAPSPTSSGSP